jgi:predicted transcriptional regulator
MSHAARTHEIFRQIEEIEEERRRIAEQDAELMSKLEAARAQADMALLLADVAGVLRDVDTRNLSEGKRTRLQGVRKRVLEQLGVAS